jgi:deoxyadenosine/deoxycytidine kinase
MLTVSGMMASGKTTLSRALAAYLGWRYIPARAPGVAYLPDLFRNPYRWAFEAQLAFASQKAFEISSALSSGFNIVVDRSLAEDIDIFAAHFRSTRAIDQRAYHIYSIVTDYFRRTLPSPDLVVYCTCTLRTIHARLRGRGRQQDHLYPPGHVDAIARRYTSWVRGYTAAPIYVVDGDRLDWRQHSVSAAVAAEVLAYLDHASVSQLPLFTSDLEEQMPLLSSAPERASGISSVAKVSTARLLKRVGTFVRPRTSARLRSPRRRYAASSSQVPFPSAYIAAPFTSRASRADSRAADTLFALGAHGVLRRDTYRRMLETVARSLSDHGVKAFIPHRDINRWGSRRLSAKRVVMECTHAVQACDVFIGILGESHGSHYEFGVAYSLGKPSIIVRCAEIPNSFIATGLSRELGRVLVVEAARLRDIPTVIIASPAIAFLKEFIPIEE